MQRRKLVSLTGLSPALLLSSIALPVPHRYYAQIAAGVIFLCVYAALGVQYVRDLREFKRTRARQDASFQGFVDAHLPPRERQG